MDKATIGAILRDRIKECKYTQEEFAEKAGIGFSTLKKYLNGTTPYSYDMLIKFAELLNCSYDYLLGYSGSAVREYHEIREQIRLSDESIRRLVEYSSCYDTSAEAKRYVKVIDMLIQQKGLITCIADYFMSSSYYIQNASDAFANTVLKASLKQFNLPDVVQEDAYELNIEDTRLIRLVSLLKDAKNLVTEEFMKELKELAPLDKLQEELNQFNALLGM